MPMLPIRELASVASVLRSGRLGRYSGPHSVTDRLEREAADLLQTKHALAVNSGTSALICALVGVGVGPGDEVLVPAYTWVSTAAAPLLLGAVPVLVDIDESLGMDPTDLEHKITARTRAIVPVHMLNLVADMDSITAIAQRHGLAVVEDACQAFGVRYRGRRVGTIGDAGAFSFSQTKNISAGEGGMVVTDDDRVATRAQMYHDVGSYSRASWTPTAEPLFVGMNLKMSEITAAVLRPQLTGLDRKLARIAVRRVATAEVLRQSGARISPHHDADDAVGLTVVLDDAASAERFSRSRGVTRLIDTERHVFTNWESIRTGRTFDTRSGPLANTDGKHDAAAPERSPRTLDILARTCRITVRPDLPVAAARWFARRVVAEYRDQPVGRNAPSGEEVRRPVPLEGADDADSREGTTGAVRR